MVINNTNVVSGVGTRLRCPCEVNCQERRKDAINLVFQKRIICSAELGKELETKGLGKYAVRKSLEFISKNKCKHIDVLKQNDGRLARSRTHGRIFFVKSLSRRNLLRFIEDHLTNLQKRILTKFTRLHKDIYYFSLYEIKKLVPYQGNSIQFALQKLLRLGLIKEHKFEKTTFFVKPKNLERLIEEKQTVLENDKLEYKTIKAVHEIIMNLYPPNLISRYRGAIRPKGQETLRLTGGMTFDIFYKFNIEIMKKNFFAIDVYTRIPVNGYTINSFLKKIEWATIKIHTDVEKVLNNKTYGLIVYRRATPKAIDLANEKGVRLIRLTDIKLNLNEIKEYPEKY